jgi:hypothetical protein
MKLFDSRDNHLSRLENFCFMSVPLTGIMVRILAESLFC